MMTDAEVARTITGLIASALQGNVTVGDVDALIIAALRVEREACAKIADDEEFPPDRVDHDAAAAHVSLAIAAKIRARGDGSER